jgi:hypothetical protein
MVKNRRLNKMYYYPPIRKQFYFSYKIDEINALLSFYKPYSIKSKVVWFLWRNFKIIRSLFIINNSVFKEEFCFIGNAIGDNENIVCINTGAQGPEQKTTIGIYDELGIPKYIIKYSKKNKARILTKNEYNILKKLPVSDIFPKLINYSNNDSYTILVTSFLSGLKPRNSKLTLGLVNLIIYINSLSIEGYNYKGFSKLRYTFAHGDFSPGNVLREKEKYKVFDWEMAGMYPLGYDLFHYIFQPKLLLHSNINIEKTLSFYNQLISVYFNAFSTTKWWEYFVEFIKIKINLEQGRGNQRLEKQYRKLIKFSIKNESFINS